MKLIELSIRTETETTYEEVIRTRHVPQDVETPVPGEDATFTVTRTYVKEEYIENLPTGKATKRVIAAFWQDEVSGEARRESYYQNEHLAYCTEGKIPPLIEDFGPAQAAHLIALAEWND